MPIADALSITLLGMGVVFSGLILTATMIWSFSALPQLLSRAAAQTQPLPSDSPEEGAPVPPEILAVITTVLEVEKRLYGSRPIQPESLEKPEENS